MFRAISSCSLLTLFLFQALTCLAAERVESKDKNKDGKEDTWYYYKDGAVYKKEYDRNFDGRADFGIVIEGRQLIQKKYDDNFDGRFEKTVKKPDKGSTGKIQTAAV